MQVYIFLHKLHCIARACSSSNNSRSKQAHAPRPVATYLGGSFSRGHARYTSIGIVMSDNYIIVQLTPTQTQVGRCSNTRQEMRVFISTKFPSPTFITIETFWSFYILIKKAFVLKKAFIFPLKKINNFKDRPRSDIYFTLTSKCVFNFNNLLTCYESF